MSGTDVVDEPRGEGSLPRPLPVADRFMQSLFRAGIPPSWVRPQGAEVRVRVEAVSVRSAPAERMHPGVRIEDAAHRAGLSYRALRARAVGHVDPATPPVRATKFQQSPAKTDYVSLTYVLRNGDDATKT
jgi:hypothetical protein